MEPTTCQIRTITKFQWAIVKVGPCTTRDAATALAAQFPEICELLVRESCSKEGVYTYYAATRVCVWEDRMTGRINKAGFNRLATIRRTAVKLGIAVDESSI